MDQTFELKFWQLLVLVMAAAAVAVLVTAALPIIPGLLLRAVPISAICVVGYYFRGVPGFTTAVGLCSIPAYLVGFGSAAACAKAGFALFGVVGALLGWLTGGFIGAGSPSVLAGAIGGVMARLVEVVD